MPESPRISVIVPTFNRAGVLPRALESVFAQTWTDWELIVVDDGSTDDTERIVRGIEDPRIRYLRHERNRGASAARNTGIRAARGRFLAFLDSDDQWQPHKLNAQLAVFETSRFRPLSVVGCGMTVLRRGEDITRLPTSRGEVFSVHLRRRLGVWDTSTLCVRNEPDPVLFDESLPAYQDFDYLAQHLKRGAFDTSLP